MKTIYTESKQSEQEYRKLAQQGAKLGIPVTECFLQMEVSMPDGSILHAHKQSHTHGYGTPIMRWRAVYLVSMIVITLSAQEKLTVKIPPETFTIILVRVKSQFLNKITMLRVLMMDIEGHWVRQIGELLSGQVLMLKVLKIMRFTLNVLTGSE